MNILDGGTAFLYPYGTEANMSKVDRNNPRRAGGSESRYTFYDFHAEFPDDAAALDWLFHQRWPEGVFCPKCQRVTKHHRERSRPSYSCQFCGHRVHPMKGTIFEDSATSLRLWFHAMYLMASTRCGISAKQLERELGVTYKTAWRMFHQIRSLLGQAGAVACRSGRSWGSLSGRPAGTTERSSSRSPMGAEPPSWCPTP